MSSVETRVRYLDSERMTNNEIPRIYDRDSRRTVTSFFDVAVHDAREIRGELNLDVTGFDLFEMRSAVKDFTDKEQIETIYFEEVKDLVKKATGASEVFVSQHQRRTEDPTDFNKAYARFVHCDYDQDTARSASLNLLKRLGRNVSEFESYDFAWYNSWQPYDNAVYKNPLAILDSRSLEAEDIRPYFYGLSQRENKSAMPVWRANHRFYYVSLMQPHEIWLIKQLDTRDGRARVAPHTSFDDPNSSDSAPPRRSIEVRLMCTFH